MSPKHTDSSASSAEERRDPPAIVGIDLGTTYSAIARLDDLGRPTTLANAEGDLVTPSAVLIDGRDIVVGKEALKALPTEPERVAYCVKRDVGQELFHRSLDGRKFPPEVLQALILKKLTGDARRQIGDFHQVVVTVPAYFDEVRRKSTQDAGYIAGLDVVDIINEPTAAAVSFGFQQGFLDQQGEASSPRRILVYDLGGGTFDVTLMEISGSDFKALATGGDVQLGGRDWDQRLTDFVAELFFNKHGVDPREDPSAAGRLWRDCEDAKRTLSARSKASIACDYRGFALRVEVTREKFQELTADLIDRSRFTTRQVLKDAGLGWSDVDRVLLVGGSSRMPMVREMLKMLSGSEPDSSVSADEAVAHGAALYAGILVGKEDSPYRPNFKIQNVNSHTLGIVGTNPQTGRKRVAVLIPRNTTLPATAKRTFKTQHAGQRSVLVQIVEGESTSPEACTPIGQCTIKDLPPNLPKHTPVIVEFRYGADGRLTVFVELADTGQRARHEIDRAHGLEKSGLDSWRKWVDDVWQG